MDSKEMEQIVNRVVEVINENYILVPKKQPIKAVSSNAAFVQFTLEFVCEALQMTEEQVKSRSRKSAFVFARSLYLYLCDEFKPKSLTDQKIADLVNTARSMAVLHPKNMRDIMSVDADYRTLITGYAKEFSEKLQKAKEDDKQK